MKICTCIALRCSDFQSLLCWKLLKTMEIYHVPTHKINDTYLGIDKNRHHLFPSFPTRLVNNIEKIKHDSDALLKTSTSEMLLKTRSTMPLVRPLQSLSPRKTNGTSTNKFSQNGSLKRIRRVQKTIDKEFDYIQPIATSFSNFETCNESVQANGVTILKLEIHELKDVRAWTQSVVDPFLKDLRLAIIQNKPRELEEYVMSYLARLFQKRPPPQCVDKVYVEAPTQKTIRKLSKRRVTRRDSLISLIRQKHSIVNETDDGDDENNNDDDDDMNKTGEESGPESSSGAGGTMNSIENNFADLHISKSLPRK